MCENIVDRLFEHLRNRRPPGSDAVPTDSEKFEFITTMILSDPALVDVKEKVTGIWQLRSRPVDISVLEDFRLQVSTCIKPLPECLSRKIGLLHLFHQNHAGDMVRGLMRDEMGTVFMMCLIHTALSSHEADSLIDLYLPKIQVEIDAAGEVQLDAGLPKSVSVGEIKSSYTDKSSPS